MKPILITIGVVIFCAGLAVVAVFSAIMIGVSEFDLRIDE